MHLLFRSTKVPLNPKVEKKNSVFEQWGNIVDLGVALKLTMNGTGRAAESSRGCRSPKSRLLRTYMKYPL